MIQDDGYGYFKIGGEIHYLKDDDSRAYLILRDIFDRAELVNKDGFMTEPMVIEDVGQDYLTAALECTVNDEPEYTENFRSQGKIDDNTWAISTRTVHVPENKRAEGNLIAGSGKEYTGNDPDVPEGAFEYSMCGYISHTDKDWKLKIVGTGW